MYNLCRTNVLEEETYMNDDERKLKKLIEILRDLYELQEIREKKKATEVALSDSKDVGLSI